MKMRERRRRQTRHCLQGWFESAGFLARQLRYKEKRRLLRESYLQGLRG
jgi:hypothetical protein